MAAITRFAGAELQLLSPSDQRVKLFKERSRLGADPLEGEAREAWLRRRRFPSPPEPEVKGPSPLDDSDRAVGE